MSDFKTVDVRTVPTSSDALYNKKQEDVAKMRASLLACSDKPEDIANTVKKITVLRVIHQISRIISYLDVMDRIEEKLYQAIDNTIDTIDMNDFSSWGILLNLQSRLQDNMIESHRLLEPYLKIKDLDMLDISEYEDVYDNPENQLLSRDSRDKLRRNAQQVLHLIELNTNNELVENDR